MLKHLILAAGLLAVSASGVFAQGEDALRQAPPGDPYAKVSDIVALPEFIPSLGTLYVDPDTLPAGPFLAYDREGKLSATVYMTPIEELEAGNAYEQLPAGLPNVASVDVYYNAGHPGVEKPHTHVVLFHDDGARERLAE